MGRLGLGIAEEAFKATQEIPTGESQAHRGKLSFTAVSFSGVKPYEAPTKDLEGSGGNQESP